MNKKLQALFGLKWNPFRPDVPPEALYVTAQLDSFCWRVEQQVRDGGFAAVTGDPGNGKSVALRVLAHRLEQLKDVTVGVLTRPQSGVPDFYRELGHLFGVSLSPHNRWVGSKLLRETWLAHIDASLCRPALIIDEAQEMKPCVLSELRLLSSMHLDSRALLTVILAGDQRLADKFRAPDLLPIGSRIRVRLLLGYASPDDLRSLLDHVLDQAGNSMLMTPALKRTLCDHAAGNCRALMTMADELLACAIKRNAKRLDEQLYFDVFAIKPEALPKKAAPKSTTKRKVARR
jgi:type II secretory pathway predicted ATPase ExeA